MSFPKESWHKEVVPNFAWGVLNELNAISILSKFYLAGGTGLALIHGHRRSYDFDFFSTDLFNEEILLQEIKKLNNVTIISKDRHTLHIELKGIKVSFLGYTYPLLFQTKEFLLESGSTLRIADERDIACMKISAISSRGTKRDFIDLFIIAQQYGLQELLEFFDNKFSQAPYNKIHVLKSLTYFPDAELEPMPDMLVSVSWDSVKQFFTSEALKFL
ncbi:MAG: nucleotidyl transferase AbiEii/AbiGii toxin family protein [Bacteroidetes bacterium]|nr:nucleotidyl transferase AbiEii/AbiGii toxin family protein [Bacteroidota bacterium]